MLKEIIYKILLFFGLIPIESNDISIDNKNNNPVYESKKFMSDAEIKFYNKLSCLNDDYIVVPQVNLATIVHKKDTRFHNELFRNIDFGIFSKEFDLLLLIELNDKTHNKYDRKDRDLKVKKICNDTNIKLITFYTAYPNEKDYVIGRVKKELESLKLDNETK